MTKVIEYKVVVADNLKKLIEDVNEMVKMDFVPQGGIAIENHINVVPQPAVIFLQAVVRYGK